MKKICIILLLGIINFSTFSQSIRDSVINQIQTEGYYISSETEFYLNEGESENILKTFYPQNQYIIVAYSEDIEKPKIEINLSNNKNEILQKSENNEIYTYLKYNALENNELNIEIKNILSKKTSKISIIILFKI